MASQDVLVDDGDGEKSLREKSLNEKTATEQAVGDLEHQGEIVNLPLDPDAHLSPEERAQIVRV